MKIAIAAATLLAATIPLEPPATLFENDQVKVLRAVEKPHSKGKFHEHTRNRVMIYLQPGRQRFEYQDKRKPVVFDWHAGQVNWSKAEGMHSPELLTADPLNIIEIELKSPGPGKPLNHHLDPVAIDSKHYKVEFENPQVRVLRVTIEPHGATPLHEHSVNRVTVFLTDQEFRVKDSTGKADIVKHKAGEAIWGTPTTHQEENLTDNPFEVLAVELKP